MKMLKVSGEIPPELWNRLGVKILPKLKSGTDLKIGVDFSVTMDAASAQRIEDELKQILKDLDLNDLITITQVMKAERKD